MKDGIVYPGKRFTLQDLMNKTNSVFTTPDMSARNFPGSITKKRKFGGPYGPAGGTPQFGLYNSSLKDRGITDAPAPDAGDAGGGDAGMGESIEKFYEFVESLRNENNESTINTILEGFDVIVESKQWAKDVKPKRGKMAKLLNIPEGKKVTEVYTSGKKLANDLVKACDGDKKKAKSMLAFAANVDKTDNVLDAALKAIVD